jgi:hypothetical protein
MQPVALVSDAQPATRGGRWAEVGAAFVWALDSWRHPAASEAGWEQAVGGEGQQEQGHVEPGTPSGPAASAVPPTSAGGTT